MFAIGSFPMKIKKVLASFGPFYRKEKKIPPSPPLYCLETQREEGYSRLFNNWMKICEKIQFSLEKVELQLGHHLQEILNMSWNANTQKVKNYMAINPNFNILFLIYQLERLITLHIRSLNGCMVTLSK